MTSHITDSMVERGAKALYYRDGHRIGWNGLLAKRVRPEYLDAARVVLTAALDSHNVQGTGVMKGGK